MSFVPRRLALTISLIVSGASLSPASLAQVFIDTPTNTPLTVGSGYFYNPSLWVTKTGSITTHTTAVSVRQNLPDWQRNVFIQNDGSITAERLDGISLGAATDVRIDNTGVISGAQHAISGEQLNLLSNDGTLAGRDGAGVSITGDATVYNDGTITGAREGRLENIDGDGLRIGGIAHIENSGVIRALGASGADKNGRANTSDGISIGGGYLFNGGRFDPSTGIPRTGSITGTDNGLLVSDGHDGAATGATELRNFVDLRGLDGYGARFIGNFDDRVFNGALISGGNGVALDMGGGNDTLTLYPGARFEGLVDGGAGHNTMILEGYQYYPSDTREPDGTVETTRNFDVLQVRRGYWVLNGRGDFSEGARLSANGHLNNQGNIAGDVIVDQGATYRGRGSVNNLTVSGRLITDTVVGAPQVNGNLIMKPGSAFEFATYPDGSAATTHVVGSASLNGAYLWPQPGYSMDYPWHSTYTVLQAGSITGTFDDSNLRSYYAFLTPTLSYDNNRVNLSYTRNDVEFIDYARTRNAARAVNSIESITWRHWSNWDGSFPPPSMMRNPNPLYDALLATSETTASAALEALAGSSNANLASATLAASSQVGTSMLSAMRQMSSSSSLLVGLESAQTPELAVTGIPSSARNLNDPNARGRVWLQGLGSYGKLEGQHGNESSQQRTQGSLLGIDWSLSPLWRLGVLGGYSKTDMDSHNVDNSLRSWHAGAYAVRQDGPLALRLGAAYSQHRGNNKRTVEFAGFSERPKGDYDADSQQAFAELGYMLGNGRLNIEPFANLGYQRYHRDNFSEKGGDASLEVDAQTQDNVSSSFGVRLAHLSQLDNGISLTPQASFGWRHLYGNVDSKTLQAFLIGGDAFNIEGSALDRDSLMVEVGLAVGLSAQQNLSVGYNGELGSNSRNHAVVGQWQMSF